MEGEMKEIETKRSQTKKDLFKRQKRDNVRYTVKQIRRDRNRKTRRNRRKDRRKVTEAGKE